MRPNEGSSQWNRRRVLKSLGGSAAMVGLAGCGGGGDGGDGGDGGGSTGGGNGGSGGQNIDAWAFAIHYNILDSLSQSYSGPHTANAVEQPPGKIGQKLVTSLQSQSNMPDISLTREGQIRPFSLNGGIVNMHDLVTEHEDKLFDVAKSRFKVGPNGKKVTGDGQYYGLPNDLGPMALVYNTEVFEEAGLPTEPANVREELKTWEDYVKAGEQVKKETGASMLSFDYKGRQSGVPHALCTQAGGLYYNDDGEFAFDQQANVQALETAKKLRDVNNRQTWFSSKYMSGLKNGEIATIPAPGWIKFTMRGNRDARGSLGDMSGVWRVAPLPRLGDSPRASNFGGVPAAIPSPLPQERKDAAKDFGTYWHLSEDSFNEKLKQGAFPAIKIDDAEQMSVNEDYYGGQNVNKVFVQSAENCPTQQLPPNSDIRELHFDAYRRVLEEDKDPETVLTNINKQMVETLG